MHANVQFWSWNENNLFVNDLIQPLFVTQGKLENSTVTCGWHAAEFNCETGKMEKFPAKINDLKSYTVVVESEDVFIEI